MAFDRQAALDAGYTEAEIDAYLQNQPETPPPPAATAQAGETGEPPAPTTTVTPAGEGSMMPGLATAGLGLASAAVPLGVGIGVGKYGGRALDAIKNLATGSATAAPGPVAPAAPVAANPAVSPSYTAPAAQAQQPGVMQRGMDYARQMQKIAADKVMQSARAAAPMAESAAGMARAAAPAAIGLGTLLHSGALNANEDEELRRRRMMAPTIR